MIELTEEEEMDSDIISLVNRHLNKVVSIDSYRGYQSSIELQVRISNQLAVIIDNMDGPVEVTQGYGDSFLVHESKY